MRAGRERPEERALCAGETAGPTCDGEKTGTLRNRDHQGPPVFLPVQGLAAAVAVSLVLPLQGDAAAGTDGIGGAVWEQVDLPDR